MGNTLTEEQQKTFDALLAEVGESGEKTDIALTHTIEAAKPLVFKAKQRKGDRFDL